MGLFVGAGERASDWGYSTRTPSPPLVMSWFSKITEASLDHNRTNALLCFYVFEHYDFSYLLNDQFRTIVSMI